MSFKPHKIHPLEEVFLKTGFPSVALDHIGVMLPWYSIDPEDVIVHTIIRRPQYAVEAPSYLDIIKCDVSEKRKVLLEMHSGLDKHEAATLLSEAGVTHIIVAKDEKDRIGAIGFNVRNSHGRCAECEIRWILDS